MKRSKTPPQAEIVVRPIEVTATPVESGLTVPAIDLPTDRNPYLVYLGRFDKKTSRETMAYALRAVAGVRAGAEPYEEGGCDIHDRQLVDPVNTAWWTLRYQHVERIKAVLMAHHSPATVNKILSALRQVIICCRKLELMTADQCAAATDVKNIKFSLLPAGKSVPDEDVRVILASMPKNSLANLRDIAIFGSLYYAGVRRVEACTLTMDRVFIRERTLRVLGKGNKERDVPILDDLMALLSPWLDVRGNDPGALFCSVAGNTVDPTHALSPQYIYDIVIDAADKSPLNYHLAPHDLRRSFITNGIEMGIDPLSMSKIVGHEQLQTTLRYDRRDEKARRAQMIKAFGKKSGR